MDAEKLASELVQILSNRTDDQTRCVGYFADIGLQEFDPKRSAIRGLMFIDEANGGLPISSPDGASSVRRFLAGMRDKERDVSMIEFRFSRPRADAPFSAEWKELSRKHGLSLSTAIAPVLDEMKARLRSKNPSSLCTSVVFEPLDRNSKFADQPMVTVLDAAGRLVDTSPPPPKVLAHLSQIEELCMAAGRFIKSGSFDFHLDRRDDGNYPYMSVATTGFPHNRSPLFPGPVRVDREPDSI